MRTPGRNRISHAPRKKPNRFHGDHINSSGNSRG